MPNPGTERSQVFTDRNAQIMFLNSATRYSTVRLWIFPKKFLDQEQVVVKNHYINHRPFLRDVREDERNRLTFILQFNSNFHEGLNCDLNHLNLKIAFLKDNPVSAFLPELKPCICRYVCLFMAQPLPRARVSALAQLLCCGYLSGQATLTSLKTQISTQ